MSKQEPAQATIEDKLNTTLFELAQLVGEQSSIYKNLQRNIQAIITTETTKARIAEAELIGRYFSAGGVPEFIEARLAAIQKEQNQ